MYTYIVAYGHVKIKSVTCYAGWTLGMNTGFVMSASRSVSDNVGLTNEPQSPSWFVSEMLCFISEKCKSLALYDIVKICTDFYTEAEIIDARGVIDSISADIRLPRTVVKVGRH